jgi:hypothetical protein
VRRRRRLEDRQHQFADHRGGPVHVDAQVVPRLVRGDRQVHRHRVQEAPEALGIDAEGPDGVNDGLEPLRRRSGIVSTVAPVSKR